MTLQKKETLAVIGLGYVGLPLALAFANVRPVIGFDISYSRIEELSRGTDKTGECTRDELLAAQNLRLTASNEDLSEANVFIVTVPTPIDEVNRPNLSSLIKASRTVASHLKTGDLVIYESTVFPGATEEVCVPILEKESGLELNVDFGCGYSPERINPGDKINRLSTIVKITSGSDAKSLKRVDEIYADIIEAGTWPVSSIKIAEAAKVIENSQRDLNIAFVNELSIIFNILGVDTMEVLEAAGTKWNFIPFKPGMVGGHCIGVDPYYLTYKAEAAGYTPEVLLAGRKINDEMAKHAALFIIKMIIKSGLEVSRCRVAVLGVTFKENCPDIRNTKVVDLIRELKDWGIKVMVHDPWASSSEVFNSFGITLVPKEELHDLDVVIVAVGHQEFRSLTPKELAHFCSNKKQRILADLKALYDRASCERLCFDVYRF